MTDTTTVALLFDDDELGTQLRQALQERGARIIHESGVRDLDSELIEQLAPAVLVVSLDDSLDEDPDALYELIDRGHTRVVFNDAQASRGLDGWDRARWARHLAAKVLAAGDIDPPRPDVDEDSTAPADAEVAEFASVPAGARSLDPESLTPGQPASENDQTREQRAASEAEALAAELESLLSGEPRVADDDSERGDGVGEIPAVPSDAHVDDMVVSEPSTAGAGWDALAFDDAPTGATRDSREPALTRAESAMSDAAPSTTERSLHETWSLVGVDDASAPSVPADEDEHCSVEKVSAADYLAPPAEPMSSTEALSMSLELETLEESMAPQPYRSGDFTDGAPEADLACVVLLGAATSSGESIRRFASALPVGLRCAIVLVQHHGGRSSAELAQELAPYCKLPLRLASAERRARAGEILIVPAGQQLTLLRDGSIDLQPTFAAGPGTPSIDATFSLLAKVFGSDALAIVFAGPATDAVSGCQAVHDRGGRVWVEQAGEDDFADMVNGVIGERLATCIAQSDELAARTIEEYR